MEESVRKAPRFLEFVVHCTCPLCFFQWGHNSELGYDIITEKMCDKCLKKKADKPKKDNKLP